MTLGEKIKRLREEKGLSQDGLSEKIGIGGRFISRYENDKSLPSIDVIKKMAKVFGVTTDYLIYDDTQKNVIQDRELLKQFLLIDKMDEKKKAFLKRFIRMIILDDKLSDLIE